MRNLLLSTLLLFSSVNGTGICDPDQITIHFPSYLEGASVILDEEKIFHVTHEGTSREVQNCFVDTLVRNCTHAYLITFFACGGYLIVDEFTDGELYIKAKMRLNGGGWFDWLDTNVAFVSARIHSLVDGASKKEKNHFKKDTDYYTSDEDLFRKDKDWNVSDEKLFGKKKGKLFDDKEVKKLVCGHRYKDLKAYSKKIDKPDFESGPCFPEKKPNAKCVVGPGIPIARLPIRIPGMNPPYQKAPREIVRQPLPIIIGPTFSA